VSGGSAGGRRRRHCRTIPEPAAGPSASTGLCTHATRHAPAGSTVVHGSVGWWFAGWRRDEAKRKPAVSSQSIMRGGAAVSVSTDGGASFAARGGVSCGVAVGAREGANGHTARRTRPDHVTRAKSRRGSRWLARSRAWFVGGAGLTWFGRSRRVEAGAVRVSPPGRAARRADRPARTYGRCPCADKLPHRVNAFQIHLDI
jgi:hypothetical protein